MSWKDLIPELHALDRGDADAATRIHARFGTTQAVLVSDMSGFSRITHKRGITAFLVLIQRMRLMCGPCVEAVGGRVVKAEADNLIAVFPDADAALTAAIAMHAACLADAEGRAVDDQVHVCLGIGYGEILDIGNDIFGNELNLASKLGEDLADPEEILLTPAAAEGLTERLAPYNPESHSLLISGLHLNYWRISV